MPAGRLTRELDGTVHQFCKYCDQEMYFRMRAHDWRCWCCDDRPQACPHASSIERFCPVCGKLIKVIGSTKDGRLIGECKDAFTADQWLSDLDSDGR